MLLYTLSMCSIKSVPLPLAGLPNEHLCLLQLEQQIPRAANPLSSTLTGSDRIDSAGCTLAVLSPTSISIHFRLMRLDRDLDSKRRAFKQVPLTANFQARTTLRHISTIFRRHLFLPTLPGLKGSHELSRLALDLPPCCCCRCRRYS